MLTELQVSEIKTKHPIVCEVEVDEKDFAFRKPRRVEYDRWYDSYSSGKKSQASYELALATLVYPLNANGAPDQMALRAALENEPACLCTRLDTEIIKLAGAGKEGKAQAL